ncbi:hydroxymethylglutaryl-CoA lyase [Rhodococcus sp. UNC23MFCrub1.1]|uniref:hydroxymethylglutaryl-CoA lyase n=1 Tax=Rhodococcus sp. UNC23MFCrub1.1 TaxID=1449068 RepID=UPI0004810D64|nr:hydroxymethylglutaryl-CoA lyase [Rhodococcus sp. UNC23MFCrub1.1]
MTLPQSVIVREVGAREGMQIEKGPIATEEKIRLVDLLSECSFSEIEVTSFVSPKWVPQMADAEEVAAGFTRRPGIDYTCVYLNKRGLERALSVGTLDVKAALVVSASEEFSRQNMRRSTEQVLADIPASLAVAQAAHIPVAYLSVAAAFGCNYGGDVAVETVIDRFARALDVASESGVDVSTLLLADTMGWANPEQVRRTVSEVRTRWPDHDIRMHLHDTRGMGIANAYAAMQLGAREFDSSVAGLGGCPFGGDHGAAGNIATEEFVHMCHEMGVETGVDLDRLIEVALEAESIVGHTLPGKVMRGRALHTYR